MMLTMLTMLMMMMLLMMMPDDDDDDDDDEEYERQHEAPRARNVCRTTSPHEPDDAPRARGIYAKLNRLICRPGHDEREAYMRSSIALYAGRTTTSARHMESYIALCAGRATASARHMESYIALYAGRASASARHMESYIALYAGRPNAERRAQGDEGATGEREAYGELNPLMCRPATRRIGS